MGKLNLFRMRILYVGLVCGIMVSTGVAVAGQVFLNCNCTPDTNEGGCPFTYCQCTSGQGLGAWATNEYHHNCTNAGTCNVNPHQWCSGSFPQAMVGSLPKNVTCTSPSQYVDYNYYYNDCTNWNFSDRDFNVFTYCSNNAAFCP
jgi:hypothetical protein